MCFLERHKRLPLHTVKKLNGEYFERTTLQALGLRIQLGHLKGECVNPERGPCSFTVLHTNRVHLVNIDFCRCDQHVSDRQQLLQSRWYPATVYYPKTCTTIELLNQFHILTLAGKISHHEFYLSLERLTDNLEINTPNTRYKAFMRIVHQFQAERMLKCGGRGCTEDGIECTEAGQLAIVCPVCPQPGVNLPEGWEAANEEDKYLYSLLVSMDANFRLKNRMRSSDEADPGLITGLAYFVEPKGYSQHLKRFAAQTDTSTCSGFKAITMAETKFSSGMRSTGVGMCICARHEMVRAVGDLQRGERYCNMDWVLLSALQSFALITLYIIYDIACQFKIHFKERMSQVPAKFQLPDGLEPWFAIPKCHCPAHKQECQTPHSLNLMPGVRRTDGEGIERDWSSLNPIANSTKEMGPRFRHDTIDDHLAHHNWRKLVSLGHTLCRKSLLASAESSRQQRILEDITLTIEGRNESIIPMWTSMIRLWEADKSQPNPYEFTKTHSAKSQKEVRLELIEDEWKALAAGTRLLHKTTPTSFLVACLGLEDKQRKIRMARKQVDMMPQQATDLQQGCLTIQTTLDRIRSAQRAYMPILESLIAEETDETTSCDIEDMPLWLPSVVDASQRGSGCLHGLAAKEEALREAQCYDALDKIRALQRGKAHLVIYKNHNIRGQRPSTRAQTSLDRLNDCICMEVIRYREARVALLSLRGGGPWENILQPLHDGDLRPPSTFDIDDPDDTIGADSKKKSQKKLQAQHQLGEGHKKASWVWTTTGTLPEEDDDDFEISEVVRIEWAKARARALRWKEEVCLLREEMCRVRITLQVRAEWWRSQGTPWEGLDPDTAEGVQAYAFRQAKVNDTLLKQFTEL
ncbi:hypothetical protein BDN71DRAFT_1420467 [Pleurotus eryngii]|uniref:CxC2-like cysteine cluster KDZ transposase-associated domain-containing protein n=1 Tax=Pleurotus eryngii TaxID=5323 RepID=A0A9P6DEK9_PLEER|nr:hypothetical protein BDN71DRAFT_1420467 [Pleurotus eryngii]